jgi:tetratricopeptide (TPR) repeat protein
MSHPSEEILVRFALRDRDALVDQAAIATHVELCDSCRSFVEDVAEFDRVAADPEAWWLSSEILSGKSRAPLLDFRDRLQREDEDAEKLLGPLLTSSYKFAYADIARKPAYRTGGVVRFLCREANRQCEREPLYALTLAETADLIARALPDDYYPADNVWRLRGDALVEIAIACRYLGGRFQPACDALDRAAKAYAHLLVSERDLARIAYVRGTVLWTQQKFTEAIEEERRAAALYAALADNDGFTRARLMEAILLMRLRDFVPAKKAFQELYASASENDLTRARAGSSLADCLIAMGDTGEALRYATEAEQIFRASNLPTEAARLQWTIAYATLVSGNSDEAVSRLQSVVRQLSGLRMESDAALAKLDLVEAYVAVGRVIDASPVASEILRYFKTHDMLTGALTAAAFVEEAAKQKRLTRRQVSEVRDYLKRLGDEPQLAFIVPD